MFPSILSRTAQQKLFWQIVASFAISVILSRVPIKCNANQIYLITQRQLHPFRCCFFIDCGTNITLSDGSVTFGKTTFGSKAKIKCNKGFVANKGSVKCLASGHWETPTCTIKGIVASFLLYSARLPR